MKVQKINNFTIKPIKDDKDKKIIKHKELFNDKYPNIFISASKGSGKSTLILRIVENMAVKRKNDLSTNIYLFSSTFQNDPVYKKLIKDCKKLGINMTIFYDDNYNEIFEDLLPILSERSEKFDNTNNKYIYPLSIIIWDDIDIKQNYIYEILRTNRHYKICNILSSQNYKDLLPKCRSNLNYLLLFNMTDNQAEKIHEEQLINYMSLEKFFNIFASIKAQNKYNFLYVDCKNGELRMNFNYNIKYKDEE